MGRTKLYQEEINLSFQRLEELHPYMSLEELTNLVSNTIHYRNKAIVHQEDTEKRKSNPIIYGAIKGEINKKNIKTIEEGREL